MGLAGMGVPGLGVGPTLMLGIETISTAAVQSGDPRDSVLVWCEDLICQLKLKPKFGRNK